MAINFGQNLEIKISHVKSDTLAEKMYWKKSTYMIYMNYFFGGKYVLYRKENKPARNR